MDVRDAVATRFSCRAFLDRPIPESTVREILERDGRLAVTTIPVGKGELVALRR